MVDGGVGVHVGGVGVHVGGVANPSAGGDDAIDCTTAS